MAGFDYYEPTTLSEAAEILVNEGEHAVPLAGGTDLLLQIRRRLRHYRSVVNLKTVPGLAEIRYENVTGLSLGALTTFRAIETHPDIARVYPALVEAAQVVAGVQLRTLATVGGNLANASPAADSIPPLVALGATAIIDGPSGRRDLPIEQCFRGPGLTVLAPGELFAQIRLPEVAARSGSAYQRLTPRRAMDIAVVSVGAYVALDEHGRCDEARIAPGAVSPVPRRATAAEAVLVGEALTPSLLEHAGELAAGAAEPITDIRGSEDYRGAMVSVLTRRVVESAWQRAAARA